MFLFFEELLSWGSRHVGDTKVAAAERGNTETWAEKDLNDKELRIGRLAVTSEVANFRSWVAKSRATNEKDDLDKMKKDLEDYDMSFTPPISYSDKI